MPMMPVNCMDKAKDKAVIEANRTNEAWAIWTDNNGNYHVDPLRHSPKEWEWVANPQN